MAAGASPCSAVGPFCLDEPGRAVFPEPLFTLHHLLCYLPGGNYFIFLPQLKNVNATKIIRDLEHPFVYTVTCHSDRHNTNS